MCYVFVIAPQFGVFNPLISEGDGSALVCVDFMADDVITVESTLTTTTIGSTAQGIYK